MEGHIKIPPEYDKTRTAKVIVKRLEEDFDVLFDEYESQLDLDYVEKPAEQVFVNCLKEECPEFSEVSIKEEHFVDVHPLSYTGKEDEEVEDIKEEETPTEYAYSPIQANQKNNKEDHEETDLGNENLGSINCSYRSEQKIGMINTSRTHIVEKAFGFNQCANAFRTAIKRNLMINMRFGTGENTFECNQCSYRATQKSNLIRHMRTHTEERTHTVEKPYGCNQCSYRATQKSRLIRHMRTHTGERPFGCNQCSIRCAWKVDLIIHMRTHTGEKPYGCNQCPYRSARKGGLIIHMKTHTGEKPYGCNQCSYRATHKCHMTTHLRTHTGEKPFGCSQCSYAATNKSSLISHMITHTGERPYGCSQCSYRCARKGDLVIHMRKHSEKKPISYSFRATLRSNMLRHITFKHVL